MKLIHRLHENQQMTTYTLRLTMVLNMDCLKMLLIVIISIVRLGMIFNVQILVTHMTPQPVHCIQTHPDHISQQLDSLADTEQQQIVYTNETNASLFTTDTATPCTFNIIPSDSETEFPNNVHDHYHNNTSITVQTNKLYSTMIKVCSQLN